MADDIVLPRTATAIGRMPPLKNMGYEVDFTDLWPLFLGGGLTAILAVAAIMGFQPFPWPVMVVVVLAPVVCAHFYIKKLIEKATPHKETYWVVSAVWSRRLVFRRTGPWWKIVIPVLDFDDAIAADPPESDCRPPLIRLTERLNGLNKEVGA